MGRDNNFNLLRMIAASAVIVSHSYPLSLGQFSKEPMLGSFWTLGGAGVVAFFAVSGYLIMQSWQRRQSLMTFVVARWARVAPGLVAALLLLTMLPNFAGNPYPGLKNGALYTLYYECLCYSVLAAVGLMGGYRAFVVCYAVFYVAVTSQYLPIDLAYGYFSLPFVLGATARLLHLPIRGSVALVLLATAIAATITGLRSDELWSLALSYGSLWFGFANLGLLAYNRIGDYSYGTYVYGWPIQQVLALVFVGIGPYAMMAAAIPIAALIGVLSWHFLESPALVWAKETAGKLGRPRGRAVEQLSKAA